MAESSDGRAWTITDADAFTDARMADITGRGSVLVAVGKSGLRDGAIWTFAP